MPKKYELLYITMLLLGIDSIRTRIKAYKAAQAYLAAQRVFEETECNHTAMIDYLIDVLNKHDIDADEFDLIALRYYVD